MNKYINEALLDPTKLPAEYPALQQVPTPWKPEDTVAIASLVGGIFGKGGGGELRNHCGSKLSAGTGRREGPPHIRRRQVRERPGGADDGERDIPVHDDLGPVDPAAHPNVDCPTLQPVDDSVTSLDDVLAAISGEAGAHA